MSLTTCQEEGERKLWAFLLSNRRCFYLSGKPGTGKTYLMERFAKITMKKMHDIYKLLGDEGNAKFRGVSFAATTNKAAEVLENATGLRCSTVHSLLMLQLRQNYNNGQEELYQKKLYTISKRVIVIDEASMINKDLADWIDKLTPDCKLIFVGDCDQLTPVNEQISPVFAWVDPQDVMILQTPVRNADSPALMELVEQFRQTVQTGEFFPIKEVPGIIDYISGSEAEKLVAKTFADPTDTSARYLCHSNSRVNQLNEYIRHCRGLGDYFEPGEILVAASAYNRGSTSLPTERRVMIIEQLSPSAEPKGYAGTTPNGDELMGVTYRVSKQLSLAQPVDTFDVVVPFDTGYYLQTVRNAKKRKDWQVYFALKGHFADLRNSEACTVHKSQGSTYDTVFVDLTDIGASFDPDAVARLLFVAFSRPRSRIYLVGNLPHRYQQGIP